ncbi:MAG TPA: phosphoribosyltransferase [Chromatiales bacterium]|nr:phosphoribosyltransferase [Chromatiales bacterium]
MAPVLRCELITWSQVQNLCQKLARRIRDSGYRPDLIVAIGRGGYVPARLLCDCLDIMDLTSIKIEHYLAGSDRQAEALIRYPLRAEIRDLRVLLVDDVNDSGDTLAVAIRHLQTFAPAEIRTAVLHHKIISHVAVDYSAARIVKWRWLIYPWAVIEDISGFLRRMSPRPRSREDAQRQLAERLGIRLPLARLQTILDFMEPAP